MTIFSQIFQISRTLPIRHGCGDILEHAKKLAIDEIRAHNHLVNIRNTGYNCFLAAVAWFFIKNDATNPLDGSSDDYKNFYNTLNLDGIKFGKPVTISQIKKFVKKNQAALDLRINILGAERDEIYAYDIGIGSKNG